MSGKWEGSYCPAAAIRLANKVIREFRPENFPQRLCNASKKFCLGGVITFRRFFDLDYKALDDENPIAPWGNCFSG